MQHCETCGKDFYSDTEFEQHTQIELLQKIATGNADLFHHIIQNLNMLNIQQIMRTEKLGISEAATRYYEYVDALNKVGREVNKRWSEKHGVV